MWDISGILWMLAIGAVLFVPLERLLPAPKAGRRGRAALVADLLHATVGGQMTKVCAALLLAIMLSGSAHTGVAGHWPLAVQVIVLLLICDFLIYAVHRLEHAVPLLWRFHRIHHSSTHLDWLASARVHPMEQIAITTLTGLPMYLVGFSTTAIAIYLAGYTFHSALLHANTRLSFGPLEAVFTPPRIHHWHHADQVEAYDSNFGSQLVIWDRLFGTAYRPDADRPARFGVDAPPAEDFAAHLLAPFRAQPEPFTPTFDGTMAVPASVSGNR
ncbi:fatty acid hydroxylase [Novosphingobium colocasiae]|uniref:Fatty acid hydroxylase n=2 Tax=Novosphingobium colocasiae TaxID=1256513 RepID=A0A918PDM2_9SPHN|nr:fatty acid hydroxylase [Novosphingobium colocasiae]